MASTSFTIEAGHAPSLTTATTTSIVTSAVVTSHPRSNTSSDSNRPNTSDKPFTASTITIPVKPRSNSLRQPSNKSANNNTININTPDNSSGKSSSNDEKNNSILHAHRQNHNSSKLPAFRFADLQKDALVRPNLLQHHIPPSPVSPTPGTPNPGRRSPVTTAETVGADKTRSSETHQQNQQQEPDSLRDVHDTRSPDQNKPGQRSRHIPASSPERPTHNNHRTTKNLAVSPEYSKPDRISHLSQSRNRASTFQTTSDTNILSPSSASKRPASFPDSPTAVAKLSKAISPGKSQDREVSDLTSPQPNGTSADHGSVLTHSRRAASDSATKHWAQGQRELLLPKTVEAVKSDEKRRSRPPVSFKPPIIASPASGRAVIPPIRAFRSSGSRKSLVLDMHTRRVSYDDSSDGSSDPNHRDRTLRALEGRADDDYSQMTPPDSAEVTPDDTTGDIFMRIAREDPAKRGSDDNGTVEEHSAVTRLSRSSHRRPFSAAIPSYQVSSPPQITRRLSDQRENSKTRRMANEQSAQHMTRELNYRGISREQQPQSSNNTIEEPVRTQSGRQTSLKPSPITPRTLAFHDSQSEVGSAYSRRRSSITESNGGLPSRASQLRNANVGYGQGRTYNSSPLAARAMDTPSHHPGESNHGVEGTESSASTAAPSMIWDELDDLKSRIHRLELTGKPPATSAAAMSRVSDERPATAVTNATTMSASPKRGAAPNAPQADASSTTSSQREAQPILLSALSKTKGIVSPDVYTAIESAANDALALASMMGAPGQPGPISSGASTIGGGGSVTDRQLRRKAESICRSLTELCLALTEDAPVKSTQVVLAAPREKEVVTSPTTTKLITLPSQRRPAALNDQTMARLNQTPRAPSSLEQRRNTLLGSTPLASPRFAALPGTPTDGVGRKSSLLVARSRRAGTEEPEEQPGRKSSLLLRSRRAGTEEPDEGRKTSLLLRGRRGTNDDEDNELKFRAPSRAVTEVNSLRPLPRNYASAAEPETNGAGSSALPRRRLVPSSLNSRLIAPASPAASLPASGRRFLDRSTPERDTSSVAEKLAEDRGQRQFSLSQTAMLNRTDSLSRRRRESSIPSLSSPSTQQAGAYR